jgi:hypothetical protein
VNKDKPWQEIGMIVYLYKTSGISLPLRADFSIILAGELRRQHQHNHSGAQ